MKIHDSRCERSSTLGVTNFEEFEGLRGTRCKSLGVRGVSDWEMGEGCRGCV